MRFYIITLSEVYPEEIEQKFGSFLEEYKLEWWRYFGNQYILATPDNIYTNFLITKISEIFNSIYFLVIEVTINDVGGIFGFPKEVSNNLPEGWSPINWFYQVRDENYIPKWERSSTNRE